MDFLGPNEIVMAGYFNGHIAQVYTGLIMKATLINQVLSFTQIARTWSDITPVFGSKAGWSSVRPSSDLESLFASGKFEQSSSELIVTMKVNSSDL